MSASTREGMVAAVTHEVAQEAAVYYASCAKACAVPEAARAATLASYIEQQREAERSTAALREAAERLCSAVEAFARYGGDPIVMRNNMFVGSDALRAALDSKGDK